MIPENIKRDATADWICASAVRWLLSPELTLRVYFMAALLDAFEILIISGYRTASEQNALLDGAPIDVSTHTTCPATGADLQVKGYMKDTAPPHIRKAFGDAARAAGLRWGGGSKADPNTGYPTDWNHVDLGPRIRG